MLLLLAAVLSLAPCADVRWIPQDAPSDASLRGLCAVSRDVCWASGSGGTVLRTTDGATWERISIPGADELDFRDVHAFDAERALLLTAGTPARIYRTGDGGATWTIAYEHDDERAFFDAMDFWDEERGLAFSDPLDGRLLVVATSDGGRTWEALARDALPPSPAGEAGFAASGTCLVTSGERDAWIGLGGAAARVFRTTDGGATWTAAATPLHTGSATSGVYSLVALEDGRGVAVGGDYAHPEASGSNAARTEDGGATWTALERGPRGYRSCVAALDARTLLAVGPSGTDVSSDGGRTWSALSDDGYHAVSTAPDGATWASGADGRIAELEILVTKRRAPAAWSRFRGPNGTGLAEGAYPTAIGPEENVAWVRPFPAGRSSPVLSAERLFLTGVEDERLFTYGLDRASGETLWRREVPRPRRETLHPKNHAAAASCAVDEDTVVAFFGDFGLVAYDHDGEERWRLPLGPFENVYGMGASPVLVGDRVVLACDQARGSFVVAVAKRTGEELWRSARPRALSGHCTPVLREAAGRTEVLVPGSFTLDAYDARTGARVWWVGGLPCEMKSVPVLLGDTLWIHGYASPLNDRGNQVELGALADSDADGDGRIAPGELSDQRARRYFQFFDLDADGALDASEWDGARAQLASVNAAMAIRVGGAGDVTETNVLWRAYRDVPQLPSPLVAGGAYWLVADQGGLVALLDPATGERLAKTRLEHAIDDYFAAPVAADGKVWLLSESGILTVLRAAREHEVLHVARFEEPCYATPALEEGRIWLRTDERLFCFAVEEL